MIALPYIGAALVALAAIAFTAFSLWRGKTRGWPLLAAALALFLLAVGGGTYWVVGQPGLALRSAQGLNTRSISGLVPLLVARVRAAPGDIRAWSFLGRAYTSTGDPGDAAKAYARAVTLARLSGHPDPDLDTAYGEALVAQGGSVGPDALAAFNEVLKLRPGDPAARFFLAQSRMEAGDKQGALALFQGLLAQAPANAPIHQILVDRIATLTAQTGGMPDPRQMVAGLAAQLKADPKNAPGWQRLINAYVVLGQTDDAKAALATARQTFAGDKAALAALDAEAKSLKLD
jgi:cytochrome c-type biogenesis protein CcmH